jgi:hypothetical protein
MLDYMHGKLALFICWKQTRWTVEQQPDYTYLLVFMDNILLTEGISNTPNKKATRCSSLTQQGSSAKIIDSRQNMQEVQS